MYVRPESRNWGLGRELLAERCTVPMGPCASESDFTVESTQDVNPHSQIFMAADV